MLPRGLLFSRALFLKSKIIQSRWHCFHLFKWRSCHRVVFVPAMRTFSFVAAFFLFSLSLFAQSSSGIVSGVVTDETGDPMVGATVMIPALSVGAITGLEGDFRLDDVPYGTYTLEVSYLSYKTVSQRVVVDDASSAVRLQLFPDSKVLEDVVEVRSERIVDSTAAVLHLKRKTLSLVDGISSEQISRSGDSNLGQASQRISGVTVEDGKYLYVRGLGDRYTKTLLNGASVPGLDPDRNAMQLDIFLSSLLDNVVVYKSFSPDLPGDFVGGLMSIETRSGRPTLGVKVGVSYSYIPRVNLSNDFLSYTGSETDWLGFDDGFRGRALSRLAKLSLPVSAPGAPNSSDVLRAVQSFSSQEMSPFPSTSFLNQRYSFSAGNGRQLLGRPFSWVLGGSYTNSYQNYQNGVSAIYDNPSTTSRVLTKDLFLEDRKSGQAATYNLLASASYEPLDGQKLKLLLMENQKGVTGSRVQSGRKPEDDPDLNYITHTLGYTERKLRSAQLFGTHDLNDGVDVSWVSSYTSSTMEQPDLRFFTFGQRADIYLIEPSIGQIPTRYFRDMSEYVRDHRVHLKKILDSARETSFLKTGFFHSSTSRRFVERQFRYDADDTLVPGGNPNLYLAEENLWSPSNEGGVYLVDGSIDGNTYDADRTLLGGYGMLSLGFWADRMVLTAGARYEHTNMRLESGDRSFETSSLLLHDILPAALVTYRAHPKGSLKASYGRTVARPIFRELAPYFSFDFVGGYILQGNPNLNRTLVDNFDARYEYYPTPAELLSVGTFFKWFKDPIERTFNPQASNTELTYRNTDNAYVVGAEIEAIKNLDFLSPFLRNLSATGNFSYLYSRVLIDEQELIIIRSYDENTSKRRPLFGQPPYVLNLSLRYEKPNAFALNVAYNILGDRISVISDGSTPNIYERSRHSLNANFVKTLNRWQLKASVNNILNDDYLFTQSFQGNDYIFQQYRQGTTFSLGGAYTLE